MADESQEEIVEEVVAEEQIVDPTALQASDLNTMATMLEAVAQRGAIRANEMELVGALYNKLMGFLVANGIRPAPGAEEQVPAGEEHTHEDGTTHAHEGGEVEHSHDQGEAENA